MKRLLTAVLVPAGLILIAAAPALEAQSNSFAGRWRCEQGNYTNRNLAADNFTISWIMDLNADGTYYAEGTFYGAVIGYPDAIRAEGRWTGSSQGVVMEGTSVVAGIQLPFNYNLKASGASLLNNEVTVAGRSSTLCERVTG